VFVLMAGAFLTPAAAAASMTLFLVAGVAGAPVFAGSGSGVVYLLGPTDGPSRRAEPRNWSSFGVLLLSLLSCRVIRVSG